VGLGFLQFFFYFKAILLKKKTTKIQVSNYHKIGNSHVQHASVAAAATIARPRPPEAASSEASGLRPLLASVRLVASVHYVASGLVNPAWPLNLHSRFFGRWRDVAAWPLATSSEAVGLPDDGVDDPLIPIVERMHRILLAPERVAIWIR
jgi:hypothetical protein